MITVRCQSIKLKADDDKRRQERERKRRVERVGALNGPCDDPKEGGASLGYFINALSM
jgi:hypothetical protein